MFLEEIAGKVKLPVLRKDFTVDPYMIYEAKAMRADAVLLICAILREEELMEYLELAEQLGLFGSGGGTFRRRGGDGKAVSSKGDRSE